MNATNCDPCGARELDPCLPGDPFVRLRYHYGMMLGAEDFAVEQRAHLLRHRLHQALLHGAGTVHGLAVGVQERDGSASMLTVSSGLAIDELGRDIPVDRGQCLDLAGLHTNALWSALTPPPGAAADSPLRQVHVVLRYAACLSLPVPVVAQPCGDLQDGLAHSRILDRAAIELEAEAPDAPAPYHRHLSVPVQADEEGLDQRRLLISRIIAGDASWSRIWRQNEAAPLLLATITVRHDATLDRTVVEFDPDDQPLIDNHVRAVLPAVQEMAERLLGQSLRAPAAGAVPAPTLRSATVTAATPLTIRLAFSAPIRPGTAAGAITLSTLGTAAADGWTAATPGIAPDGDRALLVTLASAGWSDGTMWRLAVSGAGSTPLLGSDGQPFAGWWHDATPAMGQGRDAHLVARWNP